MKQLSCEPSLVKRSKLWGRFADVKRRARFAFPETACYPPAAAMRLGKILLAPVLALALAGCAPSISGINARPDKYYQHKVTFRGRIERTQYLAHETLIEVSDTRGGRIIVRVAEAVDAETGDWVKIEGVLVPEARVDDVVLYDVVAAERVSKTRAPRFVDLM
jgi:hypothetical protein